jgi:geranylgeranyl transferase type-2 subunit beta
MSSYLEQLTLRLAMGVAALPEEVRARHAAYLLGAQQGDGGFAGREGESDMYYTGFALRGLGVLGQLYGPVAEQAAQFLEGRAGQCHNVIDLVSLVYGAALLDVAAGITAPTTASSTWRDAVAEMFTSLRRDDGGFAKASEGRASSTYSSFLVLLCMQLIDRPVEAPDRLVDFFRSQQCDGGGFREIRVAKRAGTNPTAAAVGALQILDAMTNDVRESTIEFLADMQTDEGGLRANTRIPIADLLSTFTGVLTLTDLGGGGAIDRPDALRFAKSMEQTEGGFYGAAWDDTIDVEYTFYGLGCLALLGSGGQGSLEK